ncbi:MAG TPA: RdgB/HAM1 family non-canonical purine NTP pyrophosphatase [Candidatus Eremiobacteraeota bacterium]|nr:MAG: Non-canonical purine NTP pyrophosphatase [bacterium ADurb.Bin363]HPZ09065.1 RdgB/HAM1 family non-canonical purine NTP pyrophosphatase [Candidatus Eremiobacteraeota bacterium]
MESEMLKKKLLLATKNKHKLEELLYILKPINREIITCHNIGDYPDIEETGTTFEENAWIKAKVLADFTGLLTVADDSGLEIDFLEGWPGIASARFAGPQAGFVEKNLTILNLMEGVPKEARTARFVCVAALVRRDCRTEFFKGICDGFITSSPSGIYGFGYDPIFYIPSLKATMAELSFEVKNQISHRALAFKKLTSFLSQNDI